MLCWRTNDMGIGTMLSAFAMTVLLITSATADTQPATPANDPASKIVCKKQVDTGSLVRAKKICRTRAEWDRSNTIGREEGQRMQNQGLVQPTNGIPGT
jgi:hypothetical protein